MSASIPKLPNSDNLSNQDANRTAGNGIRGTASVGISDGQGREIFRQVNVYQKINFRDNPREKEKSDANKNESEVERKERQAVHQGRDLTETSGKKSAKNEKINDSVNREYQEPLRKDNSGKSNNDRREAKSDRENNAGQKPTSNAENDDSQVAKPKYKNDSSDAKNNNARTQNNSRTAPPNNESRNAKLSIQLSAETPSNENQIFKLPNGNQSAKPNNETLRLSIESSRQNTHQDNGTLLQTKKGQDSTNTSPQELSRGRGHNESKANNSNLVTVLEDVVQDLQLFNKPNKTTLRLNVESNRQNTRQDNGILSQTKKAQEAANTPPLELSRGHNESKANNVNLADVIEDVVQDTSLFNNRNQRNNNNRSQTNNGNQTNNTALLRNAQNPPPQTRQLNLTINNYSEIEIFSAVDNHFTDAPKNNPNSTDTRLNKFLGAVIKQIFRENDVYLSSKAISNLIEHHDTNGSLRPNNSTLDLLPKEILRLVEMLEKQILQTPDRQQIDNKYTSSRVNIEIPLELDNQIQAAKNLFTQIFGASDAKQFSQMNIQERMLAAVEIFLKNLPAEMPGNLQFNSIEKILAGFLLARGLVNPDSRNSTENLLGMMQSAAADKVSLTTMRNFGGLVKVLISDAALSKSTANLENAVQKFARILVTIKCLDAVLTAVKLASQNEFANGNVGRSLAIVQVYELINRLVLAGERAMKEAAIEVAQKNAAAKGEPDKNTRSVFPSGTIADLTETDAASKKNADSKNVAAESALRNFLEFNPMFAGDKSISAFDNSDTARQAQNDFLDRHQIEIEQWLRSGNHRLVKDIDFEKPIGIVVERGANDFFSATTARIVLMRDGSVQGWHFLKSFLVS